MQCRPSAQAQLSYKKASCGGEGGLLFSGNSARILTGGEIHWVGGQPLAPGDQETGDTGQVSTKDVAQ